MSTEINEAEMEYLLNDPDGPVGRDLERRALNVENAQKRLLSMHGGGRIYTTTFYRDSRGRLRRGGPRPGGPHQASAPGAPPATDTGRLRATIGHHVAVDDQGALFGSSLYAIIGSGGNPAIPGVGYAVLLEQGTRYMEPRPFLRPSLEAAKE